jgi:hypothetical protein
MPSWSADETPSDPVFFPLKNIPPEIDIASLGGEYQRLIYNWRDEIDLLQRNFDSGHGVHRMDTNEVFARLIEADFDSDATRRIGGWIYAETELKLCVLQISVV